MEPQRIGKARSLAIFVLGLWVLRMVTRFPIYARSIWPWLFFDLSAVYCEETGQGRPMSQAKCPLGGETEQTSRETAESQTAPLRMPLRQRNKSHVMHVGNIRLPADCACVTSGPRDPRTSVAGAGPPGKMAAWVPCLRWGWAAVSFGRHRGLSASLARKPPRAWWLSG